MRKLLKIIKYKEKILLIYLNKKNLLVISNYKILMCFKIYQF